MRVWDFMRKVSLSVEGIAHGTTGYDRSRYKNRSLPVSEHLELAMLLLLSFHFLLDVRTALLRGCVRVCVCGDFLLLIWIWISIGALSIYSANRIAYYMPFALDPLRRRLVHGTHTVVSSFFLHRVFRSFFVRSRYRLLCSLHFIRIHLTIYSTKWNSPYAKWILYKNTEHLRERVRERASICLRHVCRAQSHSSNTSY